MVLRRERLLRMRDLSEIATQLNIRENYLQTIEEGSFEDLPSTTYAGGFVKAYADLLGLDSAAIADRFRAEMGEAEVEPRPGLVVEPPPIRISSAAILLLVILLVAMAYSG
jgi:cytoskeleton protein RodZ